MRVSEDSQGEWTSERRERARQKEPFKTEIFRRRTGEESEGGREVASGKMGEEPRSWHPGALEWDVSRRNVQCCRVLFGDSGGMMGA